MSNLDVWGLSLIGAGVAMLAVARSFIWPRILQTSIRSGDAAQAEREFEAPGSVKATSPLAG